MSEERERIRKPDFKWKEAEKNVYKIKCEREKTSWEFVALKIEREGQS